MPETRSAIIGLSNIDSFNNSAPLTRQEKVILIKYKNTSAVEANVSQICALLLLMEINLDLVVKT